MKCYEWHWLPISNNLSVQYKQSNITCLGLVFLQPLLILEKEVIPLKYENTNLFWVFSLM